MARRPGDLGGERNVAGGALGGRARGGGAGPTVATGGLNFDTTGLKQFTSQMKAAAKAVQEFWEPFSAAKVRENMRAIDQFFDRVDKRLERVAKKSAGVTLPTEPGGGGDGSGQRPTGNGGDSRVPAVPRVPGMINVRGRQPISLAYRGIQAYRNGGTSSFSGGRTPGVTPDTPATPGGGGGASISPGIAIGVATADWLVNKGVSFADKRLPQALQMEQAATQATMVGGNANWSTRYRNSVQNQLARTPGFWSTEDIAGAITQATQIGARGSTLGGMLQSAGVLQTINPSITAQQAMGANTGIHAVGVANSLQRLGVLVSPRGQMKNATQIYQEVTPRLFGTDKPSQEQILAARLPGSRKNLQIVYAFNGDQNLTDTYLTWLESNAATGSQITTVDQANKAPLAQSGLGQARQTAESQYQRQSRSDRGLISQFETEQKLRQEANDAMDKLLGKFPGLGDAIGKATGWFSTLNKALGPFALAMGGNLLGNVLRGRFPGGGGGASTPTPAPETPAPWHPSQPGGPNGTNGGSSGTGGGAAPEAAGGGVAEAAAGATIGGVARALAGPALALYTVGAATNPVYLGQGWSKKDRQQYYDSSVKNHVLPDVSPGAKARWVDQGQVPDAWFTVAEQHPGHPGGQAGVAFPGGLWWSKGTGQWNRYQRDKKAQGDTGDPVGRWAWRFVGVEVGDPNSGGATPSSLRGPGRSQGINASFLRQLQQMFADNPKLVLNSGFRTRAEQEALYKQKGPGLAAKPGSSNHEKGLAADIGPPSEYGWLAANGSKYGLKEPMPKVEPWHWEPTSAVGSSSSTPDDPGQGAAGQQAPTAAPTAAPAGAAAAGGSFSLDPRLSLGGGTLGGAAGAPAASPAGSGGSSPAGGGGTTNVNVSGSGVPSAILKTGQQMGASKQMLLAAFETGIVESNMTNPDHGDKDSVGVFQQRASWGTKEQRMDVSHAAGEFYKRAASIKNARTAGQMAQMVQRSAYPERYDQHRADAAKLLSGLGVDVSGIGDPVGASGKIPPIMVVPGPSGASGGTGRSITIQRAEFIIQMRDATYAEAARAARQIKDLLSEDDRIVQASTT